MHLQPKLLRALESAQIMPVGSDTPVAVHTRLVAATNQNLEEAVMTMARTMAAKGKLALFGCKKSINKLHDSFLPEGLEYEIDRWSELFDTHDQKEGMRAFLEGREPEFRDE